MRIAAKSRYALAAAVSLAQQYNSGEPVSTVSISETLGISKIFLEQVFSLLKHSKIVTSVKGTGGGYLLAEKPENTSVLKVLQAVESALFERTAPAVSEKASALEDVLQFSVFDKLDENIKSTLSCITLAELVIKLEMMNSKEVMYYI